MSGEPTVSAGSPTAGRATTGLRSRFPRPALLAGLLLVALNMRPALASVGPVLDRIGESLALSSAAVALLTSVPVLCFGLLAPAGPLASRRLGPERALAMALLVLLVGMACRSGPDLLTVLTGTVLIGSGIAIMNVLAPAIVKRDFPSHVGLVTGAYTTVLNVSAAVAAGTSVPIAALAGGSWRLGLLAWAGPVVPALLLWGVLGRRTRRPANITNASPALHLLRRRRTWHVVGFTAAQSVIYYSVLTWLPSVYESYGYTPARAGLMLSITTLVSAPVALILPTMAARSKSQRVHVIVIAVTAMLGLAGLTLAPLAAPILWVCLTGIGLGGAFPLALTMFVLRGRDETDTANLSMLAQGSAYLVACLGPIALGSLHDLVGTWVPGLAILLGCAAAELGFGLGAARPGHILPEHQPAQRTP